MVAPPAALKCLQSVPATPLHSQGNCRRACRTAHARASKSKLVPARPAPAPLCVSSIPKTSDQHGGTAWDLKRSSGPRPPAPGRIRPHTPRRGRSTGTRRPRSPAPGARTLPQRAGDHATCTDAIRCHKPDPRLPRCPRRRAHAPVLRPPQRSSPAGASPAHRARARRRCTRCLRAQPALAPHAAQGWPKGQCMLTERPGQALATGAALHPRCDCVRVRAGLRLACRVLQAGPTSGL